MTTSRQTVLIVGATGVVGQACLRHFASMPGWDAIGVARRPISLPPGAHSLQLDLQDEAACRAALAGRDDITHVVYAAVYEQPGGLVGGWRDQEQMRINLQMLRNVVEPLDRPDGPLRHVPRGSGTGSFDAEQHDEHLYEHDERADSQRPLRAEDARGDCVASMQLNQRLHQDDQHGGSDRTRDLPDRVGDRRPG